MTAAPITYTLNNCTVHISGQTNGFTIPVPSQVQRPDAAGLALAADFASFFPYHLDRAFVFALSRLSRLSTYNHAEMLRKAALHADLLSRQRGMEGYKAMLERVYNYYRRATAVNFMVA